MGKDKLLCNKEKVARNQSRRVVTIYYVVTYCHVDEYTRSCPFLG